VTTGAKNKAEDSNMRIAPLKWAILFAGAIQADVALFLAYPPDKGATT
jgi:hypothetical protein